MVLCYNRGGGSESCKTALSDMYLIKRRVIYGCPLSHHKQSKLNNCYVIPLYLVSYAVVLQFKLCLKLFIRNIYGYIHGYGYPLQGSVHELCNEF